MLDPAQRDFFCAKGLSLYSTPGLCQKKWIVICQEIQGSMQLFGDKSDLNCGATLMADYPWCGAKLFHIFRSNWSLVLTFRAFRIASVVCFRGAR